uniref:Uncharacterized protein n=1 Tax=Timema bartmani TaxID=61472 RepID=A0A7R9EWR0_9NEOP|nr:unnamed protein product [Timema bartmani]
MAVRMRETQDEEKRLVLFARWLGCALGRDDDAARHEDGPEEDTCLHVTDEETEIQQTKLIYSHITVGRDFRRMSIQEKPCDICLSRVFLKEAKKEMGGADNRVFNPHQVGQPDVNLTTPEANMSLNSSQRTNQKDTGSLGDGGRGRRLDCTWYLSGATRIQSAPASRTRVLTGKCLASDASLPHRVKNRRLIRCADWLAVCAKPSLSTVRSHVQATGALHSFRSDVRSQPEQSWFSLEAAGQRPALVLQLSPRREDSILSVQACGTITTTTTCGEDGLRFFNSTFSAKRETRYQLNFLHISQESVLDNLPSRHPTMLRSEECELFPPRIKVNSSGNTITSPSGPELKLLST